MPRVARRLDWMIVMASGLLLLQFLSARVAWGQQAPKKLTRSEALAAATLKVQPEYPSCAKQLHVEGVVELEAVVGENGKVEKVNIVSGNAMLSRAASDALRLWKFTPPSEDGKPAKALAPVSFTFKL